MRGGVSQCSSDTYQSKSKGIAPATAQILPYSFTFTSNAAFNNAVVSYERSNQSYKETHHTYCMVRACAREW